MKSFIANTTQHLDARLAADELAEQIEKNGLCKSSVAFIFCDIDCHIGEITALLHQRYGFDFIGQTVAGTIERNNGYSESGATMLVLTGDDLCLATGLTEVMVQDNALTMIQSSYENALQKIGQRPELIINCAPSCADILDETYVLGLDNASDGVPVFGCLATDHVYGRVDFVYINGTMIKNGMVFVLLSGDVKPLFSIKHRLSIKGRS